MHVTNFSFQVWWPIVHTTKNDAELSYITFFLYDDGRESNPLHTCIVQKDVSIDAMKLNKMYAGTLQDNLERGFVARLGTSSIHKLQNLQIDDFFSRARSPYRERCVFQDRPRRFMKYS